MAHFITIVKAVAAALLNRICFWLKPLTWASECLPEHPVSAYVGLVGSSFRLQSCMLAEDSYLLDNMTYI